MWDSSQVAHLKRFARLLPQYHVSIKSLKVLVCDCALFRDSKTIMHWLRNTACLITFGILLLWLAVRSGQDTKECAFHVEGTTQKAWQSENAKVFQWNEEGFTLERWEIQVEPDYGGPESRRLLSFDFALEKKPFSNCFRKLAKKQSTVVLKDDWLTWAYFVGRRASHLKWTFLKKEQCRGHSLKSVSECLWWHNC